MENCWNHVPFILTRTHFPAYIELKVPSFTFSVWIQGQSFAWQIWVRPPFRKILSHSRFVMLLYARLPLTDKTHSYRTIKCFICAHRVRRKCILQLLHPAKLKPASEMHPYGSPETLEFAELHPANRHPRIIKTHAFPDLPIICACS
jgi:hypothetical protein